MSVSLGYMASHSRNLEALLQTYRQINLTIQSAFLILGTFLLSRIIESRGVPIALFLEFLLVGISIFSLVVMWKFQNVILSRGLDVNWWHIEILRTEQTLPPEERIFTRFKIFQSGNLMTPEQNARFLQPDSEVTDQEIRKLLDADFDHVRNVINLYILRGMRLIWIIVVALSIGSFFI
jgi:hypothetical protein